MLTCACTFHHVTALLHALQEVQASSPISGVGSGGSGDGGGGPARQGSVTWANDTILTPGSASSGSRYGCDLFLEAHNLYISKHTSPKKRKKKRTNVRKKERDQERERACMWGRGRGRERTRENESERRSRCRSLQMRAFTIYEMNSQHCGRGKERVQEVLPTVLKEDASAAFGM